MVNLVEAKVTPALLKWAREHASLTLDDAAKKINVALERLAEWEKGNAYPTFDELSKISNVYRLPVAMFYLSELPDLPLLERDKTAKEAFEYLKSKGFTADHYRYELEKDGIV